MVKEVRIIVKGEVVGVGFRAFVKAQARPLGLTGYARNVGYDGVEVVGQGEDLKLQTFLGQIRQGPPGVRATSIDVSWREPDSVFEGFEIR